MTTVHAKEGVDMKRALIVTLIAGALALSPALPLPMFAAEPLAGPTPAPGATLDSTPCGLGGPSLAVGGGCCQRQGGLCRCRNGNPTCCDGSPGAGLRKPMISSSRRSVIGVSTRRPCSSLQVAGVPFFNPSCSRNSAGITTCPLELTTVR